MRPGSSLPLAVFLALATFPTGIAVAQTPDGTLLFNDPNDTILVDGQTVLGTNATYEAWVYFPAGTTLTGNVFVEWTDFLEDKQLGVGPTYSFGFLFPTATVLQYVGGTTTEAWHHVAYLQDGDAQQGAPQQQRLYIDGDLVASQSASSDISDATGVCYVGAGVHEQIYTSFYGFLDSVRISDVARYSGDSFEVPGQDLPSDEHTLLLYHFDKDEFFVEDGHTRITDLSGNDRHGTLGEGFGEATSPAVPARQGDFDCNGTLAAADALRVLRASVELPNAQSEPCPDLGELLTTGLFGDIDCNGTLTASDALKTLRAVVGLELVQKEQCPALLAPV